MPRSIYFSNLFKNYGLLFLALSTGCLGADAAGEAISIVWVTQ